MAFVTAAAEAPAAPTGPGCPEGHLANTRNVIRHTARRIMKKIIVLIAVLLLVNACSDENSTALVPDDDKDVQPSLFIDSLAVYVHTNIGGDWRWYISTKFYRKFDGYSGKLYTFTLTFIDIGMTETMSLENTHPDCYEQIGELNPITIGYPSNDDIFMDYDSLTAYVTITGLFQDCSSGAADSIAVLSWSGFTEAKVSK
jgi:hypothetical protein